MAACSDCDLEADNFEINSKARFEKASATILESTVSVRGKSSHTGEVEEAI
jgi:hypothetical protein